MDRRPYQYSASSQIRSLRGSRETWVVATGRGGGSRMSVIRANANQNSITYLQSFFFVSLILVVYSHDARVRAHERSASPPSGENDSPVRYSIKANAVSSSICPDESISL